MKMRQLIATVALALLGTGATAPPRVQTSPPAPKPTVRSRAEAAGPCVTATAECRETLTIAGAKLTYYRTFPLARRDDRIHRAVVVIHGGQRTPERYFKALVDATVASDRVSDTLILAPGFKIGEDKPARGDLWWDTDDGWKKGDLSTTTLPERVSSFEVADRLVALVADRRQFPNLREVIITGHSSGGQFTQRYAAGTRVDASLPDVKVRFVVANPSSYLYFTKHRPVSGSPDTFEVPADTACAYHAYKHGLEGRNEYMSRAGEAQIALQYRNRDVTYLLGTADTDPNHDGLDKSCAGMLQGRFRYERGLAFKAYMDRFFAPHNHRVVRVPDVGHEGERMFGSSEGRGVLFGGGAPATFVIAIHGGEGVRPRAEMTPELEGEYREALAQAVEAGRSTLRSGGTAIAAVEAAIRVMEDSPLFNAGKGASFNRAGFHELDAAIMDGATLKAGGVAGVQHVRNPISLARLVMEKSPHVLMAGTGAESFALEQGVQLVPASYFFTQHKWESLQRRLHQNTPYGRPPSTPEEEDPAAFGTVGAVALDRHGNLAAGTSTGGREGKLPGRVGDSPVIGAGTYANNETLAVSSTGLGEYVLRTVATKEMSDLMAIGGLSVGEATERVRKSIADLGGSIGVVAIDRQGTVAMPFTGDGMYRARAAGIGPAVVEIYRP